MMGYSEVFYSKLEMLAKILILLELFDEYYRERRYIASKKKKNIQQKSLSNNKKQNNKPLKKCEALTDENSQKCKSNIGGNIKPKEVRVDNTFTSKIPVVIAEKRVDIPVEIAIELEEEALEIKRSSHNVYLNEATLIPVEDNKQKKGKLFLKGFVKNSLEYSNEKHINNAIISGRIKHSIVYIPFECTTIIDYTFPPNFNFKDDVREIALNVSNNPDDNEHMSISEESIKFSEQICCDINKAKIYGTRTYSKNPLNDNLKLESVFTRLQEKVIVELYLTLTQRQCVNMIT
ncbi:DUF7852 domain-containing protein [Clostridium sp. ZS2-4]|uniref:DUF7852 domain-containing protein n=1 Tax=Clostridium sp. ZS2-4 TaxID=2987703 RepID=UPI00227B198F|nr:hypothetical protein [Clostridium sp. ZS2-4]MCY6356566.1 hypothetical protein [Clostridium sp. ZS2-4]